MGEPAAPVARPRHEAYRVECPRLVMLVCAAYLVIQIGLPAVLLWSERPARFGWQMFSGVRRPPAFTLVRSDGSTEPVPPVVAGHRRDDLDYGRHAPSYLCARFPDAIAVRVDGRDEPCRR